MSTVVVVLTKDNKWVVVGRNVKESDIPEGTVFRLEEARSKRLVLPKGALKLAKSIHKSNMRAISK